MLEQFIEKNFRDESLAIIAMANQIIADYQAQGFTLTLRQLYYQFVARDLIPNTERSYKRLGKIVSDGRMAGLIDWEAIEDRTRNLQRNSHWDDAADMIRTCERQFAIDKWNTQLVRVEVWIEKEALVGVIADVCDELDVPYFACRGYTSQSEQWRAGRRFSEYETNGQDVVVLHLGDHDPSGIDMTRDNRDRLHTFACSYSIDVNRLALNIDQVNEYDPPPNPAKFTDSRASSYVDRYGPVSWELDALEPAVITQLIRDNVEQLRDEDAWEEALEYEADVRTLFAKFREQLEEDDA